MNLITLVMTCLLTFPPESQCLRGSAAQTADGKIRVRVPGFLSRVFPLLVRPWGLTNQNFVSCSFWDNVEEYCRAMRTTDDHMAHAHCMLGT